jgi:micrococcal nuclease
MGLFLRIWVRLFSRRRSNAVVPKPVIPTVRKRPEPSIVLVPPAAPPQAGTDLRGSCWVIDGDTIEINSVRVRLAGIDAPELDHPWGQQSKWALVQLCKGQTVTARIKPELSYDRVVAECFLDDGRDLSAELVRCGLALDWAKFSGGKYRHLEPSGVRRKLWRAHARQRGALAPQTDVRAERSQQARGFPQAGN